VLRTQSVAGDLPAGVNSVPASNCQDCAFLQRLFPGMLAIKDERSHEATV
jgi:hypothetical protein